MNTTVSPASIRYEQHGWRVSVVEQDGGLRFAVESINTGNTCGGIAKIEDGACLFAIAISQSTNALGSGALLFEEN